jgi:hypothetical protein
MNEKAPPLSAKLERAATAGVADEGAMAMLTDNQRAVLQMLKTSRRGYLLPTVMARGFTFEMLQGLVSTGMAVAQRDALGPSETKVPHLRITEAGRRSHTVGARLATVTLQVVDRSLCWSGGARG